MKSLLSKSRLVGLALVALPALALTTPTGCKSDDDPQGGLVIGTDTRMQVPKDIDYVSVSVYSNDALRFERLAKIKPDGTLDLPATLAIIQPESADTSVRLRLIAFGSNKPRVLHDFITTVPRAGRIAYLDLPLDFLDDGSGAGDLTPFVGSGLPQPFDATKFMPAECSQDFHDTALDGECQDNRIDSSLLPEYRDDLVGSPASCFDVAACLAAAKPVTVDAAGLDLSDCSVSAAGRDVTKLNLAFATPSTGLCLASGKCFVPLVNGNHGWKQDGARLKLPRGACSKYPRAAGEERHALRRDRLRADDVLDDHLPRGGDRRRRRGWRRRCVAAAGERYADRPTALAGHAVQPARARRRRKPPGLPVHHP